MTSLIDEYRWHAIEYGLATAEGDDVGISKSNQELQRLFKSLIKESRADELFRLYDDGNPWVQLAAAAHTLEINAPLARTKLEQLAGLRHPHLSMDAKYTLEGWDSGTLRFLN